MSGYDINYDDKRFTEVENDKEEALTEVEKTYGGMITGSDKYFQDQIKASQDWADEQTEIQNAQTDFAIQEINQQKAQAQKDYTKEQSGAYVDWQKQSNEYGANAEAIAAQGLANSGYSESSQVSMYNTYQNRVTTARESYQLAVQNYNNAITEARLQNSAALAQIAYEALAKQLELSLAGFQYKNTLLLEQANKKMEIEQIYHNRYQDVLQQINTENALAEEIRQFNESMNFQREQFAWQKAQAAKSSSGSSGSSGGKINKSKKSGTITSTGNKGADKIAGIRSNSSTSSNKGSSSKESSEPTVDMNSVLALGYGPISASRLNQLIKEGKVIETEKDGKLYYTKRFNY